MDNLKLEGCDENQGVNFTTKKVETEMNTTKREILWE